MSKRVFYVYRYQILPLSQNFQVFLYLPYSSNEELIENKNKILGEVLKDENIHYFGKGHRIISKHEASSGGFHFFRMGVQKKLSIHDEQFKSKTTYDYPNSLVFIDNDPEKQFLLIEHEADAFYNPKALKNIIENTWSRHLQRTGLIVYINEITEPSDFWDTMMLYQNRIKSLQFNFIRPNMANISGEAVKAIKMLNNSANSHKTTLGLNASKNGVLENLTPQNEEVAALVDYQAKGGGNATIRIKGHRKRIKTSERQVTIEVDEITIENIPYDKVAAILEAHLDSKDV